MKHTLKGKKSFLGLSLIFLGGIWTNVEDEILKVAVMKYGRNQWARISSLLVRKTPKQCKARWNEWLDPRIKKTDWSREEDEKLLHLAKVFPSQWGTISDLVGRTAQMCLERYERLLDAAVSDEPAGGSGNSGSLTSAAATLGESRKLRPGEIDPSPETKPARPDPVDMDEDEKEMLAEARARLANTQGKKAKRKAREKMLDEARRAAALQKRKELIAAGLPGMAFKKKSTSMDYNNEIPFERKAAPGFHDPSEELAEEAIIREVTARGTVERAPSKDVVEMAERKKDVQKERARIEAGFLPTALERKLKEQQAARKVPLKLPAPQINDSDLEQIAKVGFAAAASGYYDASATPMSPSANMTPLSNYRAGLSMAGNSTPMSSTQSQLSSVRSTPLRDQLGINASVRHQEPLDAASMLDVYNRNRLREAFKSLPKPKNDFDLSIPE